MSLTEQVQGLQHTLTAALAQAPVPPPQAPVPVPGPDSKAWETLAQALVEALNRAPVQTAVRVERVEVPVPRVERVEVPAPAPVPVVNKAAPAARVRETTPTKPRKTKSQLAEDFVREYLEQHGELPQNPAIRAATGVSNGTAGNAIKAVKAELG